MSNNELIQSDERKEFLENVMSAYFLEKNLSDLKSDLAICKRSRPSAPETPVKPKEPVEEEPRAITPMPYPEIAVPEMQSPKLWKKGLIVVVVGLVIQGICAALDINGLLGGLVMWAGIIYAIILHSQGKKQMALARQDYIEKYKKSSEYVNQCAQIDKENQRQMEEEKRRVHNKYLKACEDYQQDCRFYEQALQEYNAAHKHYIEERIPQWEKEQREILEAINSVDAALTEVYNKNIIPISYRGIGTVGWLAAFLGTSKFDLKTAIERYDSYVSQNIGKEQLEVTKMQTAILSDINRQQDYANYLQEQMLDITQQGNKTLKSISNWQKVDILLDEYRLHKRKKLRR